MIQACNIDPESHIICDQMQVVFKDKSLGNINNIPFLVNKFVMRTVYAVCRQLDI